MFAITGTNISIDSCVFSQNTCPFCCGEAINCGTDGSLMIKNSSFTLQMATLESSVCKRTTLIRSDNPKTSVFDLYDRASGSAIFAERHFTVSMSSCEWFNVNTFSFGAILSCMNACFVDITGSVFRNIVTASYIWSPGLVAIHHGRIPITDTNFYSISHQNGIILANNSHLIFSNNTFSNNTFSNNTFSNNTFSNNTFSNSTFGNNRQKCIVLMSNSSALVNSSNFLRHNMGGGDDHGGFLPANGQH